MISTSSQLCLERAVALPRQTQQPFDFESAVRAVGTTQSLDNAAQLLLDELTVNERLGLLDGDEPFWSGLKTILSVRYNEAPFILGAVPRLGIPGIRFSDGPRGVVMGASTAFPVPMARGATWDTQLERRIGDAIGREAKAQGANYFAGVCINLPRHPAWGRIQETYGEDPILLGEFGVALTEGVQQHVMACVKHFALNSMENARFQVDVQVDEDVLHEVFLPHFRRVVECGVASVMSSYNCVNGEWAGQNSKLLVDILRRHWHFSGFVLSDFIFGLRNAVLSLQNGLDVEAPFMQQRRQHLSKALESQELDRSDVDRACARILSQQIKFAATTEDQEPDAGAVFSDNHRLLAREAAGRGMVLLKNEKLDSHSLLPLDSTRMKRLAVVGRLANAANTGDRGSSQVFSPRVVTAFEGLREALPNIEVVLEDNDCAERAAKVAKDADIVICVVGYDAGDEGEYVVPSFQTNPELLDLLPEPTNTDEMTTLNLIKGNLNPTSKVSLQVGAGGDRKSLRLRARDVAILTAVAKTNRRTIVSIVAGGAVITEEWRHTVPAILISWYSGCEGGHALADVLLGKVDASGRLPFSVPTEEAHLPVYDINALQIKYDRWYGQHLLNRLTVKAAYPFGFGLSYTEFSLRSVHAELSQPDQHHDSIYVHIQVANIGSRKGRYVAQVYGLSNTHGTSQRLLLGFETTDIKAGQTARVRLKASLRPLQRWVQGRFIMPCNVVHIEAASYAGDPKAMSIQVPIK